MNIPLPSRVIKICGLREYSHFQEATSAGADLLGMVFVPGVRRKIEPEAAQEVVSRLKRELCALSMLNQQSPSFVGLFCDQPSSEVNQIVESVGLDWVQLCGEETVDYWKSIECPIFKVLHVPSVEGNVLRRRSTLESLKSSLDEVEQNGVLPILDRSSEHQPGGTGRQFDWSIAQELSDNHHRFLLAGGLTPTNLKNAIQTVSPFGVDVSSGVETNQIKDPEKIREFIQIARDAFSYARIDES